MPISTKRILDHLFEAQQTWLDDKTKFTKLFGDEQGNHLYESFLDQDANLIWLYGFMSEAQRKMFADQIEQDESLRAEPA